MTTQVKCRLCYCILSFNRVETATYDQICKCCVKRIRDKIHGHNKRARRAGVYGKLNSASWYELLVRFEFKCAHCGRQHKPSKPVTLDHIVPLKLGGTNTKFNIQPLCEHCHKTKDRADQISPLVDSKQLRNLLKKIYKKRRKAGFMKWLVSQQEARDEDYLNKVRAAWLEEGCEEHFKHFLREHTLMKWLDDRMNECKNISI